MGINSHITWEVNWLSNGVSYNKNVGLALDADFPLLVVDVSDSVRTGSYSDSRSKWDAGFFRPASKVERRVAQTCAWNGMRRCSDPHKIWNSSDSRWMGYRVTQTHVERGFTQARSKVSVLLWTRGPHFSLKRDLRVEVRFASNDLSLLIFGQPRLVCT